MLKRSKNTSSLILQAKIQRIESDETEILHGFFDFTYQYS